MTKFHKVEKKRYDGCAVDKGLCEGSCRDLHKDDCPSFYRFTFEKPRGGRGNRKIKKNKLVMKELR
jgi:hypothetical protein